MSKFVTVTKIIALMGDISKINIRPTFHTIQNMEKQLVAGARKMKYLKYENKGMVGHILTDEVFVLI